MNGDDRTPDEARPDQAPDAALMAAARRGTDLLGRDTDDLAHLWDGIAREAFGDDRDQPGDVSSDATTTGLHAVPTATDHPAATTRRPRLVRSPERRQRRTFAGALVGVAAALLVVLGISWAVTREPAPQPLATFRLDPIDTRVTQGVDGTVVATAAGKAVEVDLGDLPPPPDGTFYELWFLDEAAGKLVSLGPVGEDGTYVAPLAITPETWPALDVSVEPADGDPAHSSDSILRGPVTQTNDA